jgi:TolB-like protein/cytochrome c-type biogenesis protein CcmH/NrfG
MASIIPGYEYDIFISYRQKDNKGDRWVSEFVDALKTELESTFKEEISVYFDINPHDGLLETHDVNASLKEKLKCLVFIPIISRTYCDPKSFAWEDEFVSFVETANQDHFGLKVNLLHGNVASRVLPVRIHDLDIADINLCESLLGGVLRGVDFVYKSPGVNRPLRANEDRPQDNLNKTYYRDQVNKVANAIKEIITSITSHDERDDKVTVEQSMEVTANSKKLKIKIVIASFILLALIVLGYFFIPILSKSSKPLEKSIAVLPFINDSPDQENAYFINGIMEEILNNLKKIGDFRVISRTSVEHFRGEAKPTLPEIARKLNVNYIVEGSGQKYGNKFVLRVQLLAANKEKHLWGRSYEQVINETNDIINIQSQIAQSIASELQANITPEEKQRIDKIPTKSLKAYDAYLKGQFFYEKSSNEEDEKAVFWFKEAIRLDSTFALPWTYLSMFYCRLASTADSPEFKEAKRTSEKALELDHNSGIAIVNMAEILESEYNFEGAEEKIKAALEIDPDNQYVLRNAGRFYTRLGKRKESISLCNRALQNDPTNPTALVYLALAYFYSDSLTQAMATLNKYHELEYKGLSWLYYEILLAEGDTGRIVKEPSFDDDDNARNVALAAVNFESGHKNEAEYLCGQLVEMKIDYYAYWIAFAHAYADEPEEVCTWLERSYVMKEKRLSYLGVEPAFRKFKNEPCIRKFLNKMKFPI